MALEVIGSKRSYALKWCKPNNDDDDDESTCLESDHLWSNFYYRSDAMNSAQNIAYSH